jgi:hypothetical protein
MKRIALIIAILATSFTLHSQTVHKDASGNYVVVKAIKDSTGGRLTGEYFVTSKGEKFPIYKSDKGKYYVIRISGKTGKEYKQYLKLEN